MARSLASWFQAFSAALRSRRPLVATLSAAAAVAVGFSLALASFVPEIEPAGTSMVSGTVPASTSHDESFRADAGIAEVRLAVGGCTIFVTILSRTELLAYNTSGTLPDPHLDCDRRVATFGYPLEWIVVENRGSTSETFTVSADLYSVRFSRGILAFPAVPLLLGGVVYLTVRGLRRSVDRMTNELRQDWRR